MKLSTLEIFLKVADKNSISKAATEMFLTQPAVSQAIKALEEELGTELFLRQPRGVILTEEGKLFYQKIAEGMRSFESAKRLMTEREDLKRGTLRLGVSDIVSKYILPELLRTYRKKAPGVRQNIRSGTTENLRNLLLQGEIDLVIGFKPQRTEGLDFKKLITVHPGFVATRDIVETLPEKSELKDLKQYPLMLLDKHSGTRRLLDAYFLSKQLEVKPDIELVSHDLLVAFAKQGMGIALLAKEFSEDLVSIRTPYDFPARELGYYILSGLEPNAPTRAFIEVLKEKGTLQ